MGHKRLTKEEKHWRAEVDANTLASANEIAKDPKRMGAAKKIAATEAKELQQRTRAMQNVANRKTPTASKPATKKTTRKVSTAKKTGGTRSKASGGRRK